MSKSGTLALIATFVYVQDGITTTLFVIAKH